MIRLIVDKLGSGKNDLFLKIDLMPSFLKTADSYYLLDFLEINKTEIERLEVSNEEILSYSVIQLINYWKERMQSIENGQIKLALPTF